MPVPFLTTFSFLTSEESLTHLLIGEQTAFLNNPQLKLSFESGTFTNNSERSNHSTIPPLLVPLDGELRSASAQLEMSLEFRLAGPKA